MVPYLTNWGLETNSRADNRLIADKLRTNYCLNTKKYLLEATISIPCSAGIEINTPIKTTLGMTPSVNCKIALSPGASAPKWNSKLVTEGVSIFTEVCVEINLEYAPFQPPDGAPSRFYNFNTAELAIFITNGIFLILFHKH
uniref:Uncharacterized protein n=1 Tax=Glossina austeni TaxID=7395 RepID=A0A1A9VW62_GLOAU